MMLKRKDMNDKRAIGTRENKFLSSTTNKISKNAINCRRKVENYHRSQLFLTVFLNLNNNKTDQILGCVQLVDLFKQRKTVKN